MSEFNKIYLKEEITDMNSYEIIYKGKNKIEGDYN